MGDVKDDDGPGASPRAGWFQRLLDRTAETSIFAPDKPLAPGKRYPWREDWEPDPMAGVPRVGDRIRNTSLFKWLEERLSRG